MHTYLGKTVSILAISSAVVLSGCGSGNYKTDSGYSITIDDVKAYKANQQVFPLPYGQGSAKTNYWPELDTSTAYWEKQLQEEELVMSKMLSQWTSPQGGKKLDAQLNLHKPNVPAYVYVNVLFTAFTLGIIPMFGRFHSESDLQLSSDGESVYNHKATVSGSGTVNILIPWGYIFGHDVVGMEDSMAVNQYAPLIAHEQGLVAAISAEKPIYEQIKNSTSLQQTKVALNNPRLKFYRPLVLEQLAGIVSKRSDRLAIYPDLLQKHPGFAAYMPVKDALYFVGPKDFTVLDVIKKSKTTADKDLLNSLILAKGQPYKQFTQEEILWLNKQGLSGATIQTMIQAGRAQGGAAQAAPATQGTHATATAANGSQPAPSTAAECVKALAAKKACEHAPGPFGVGVKICMKSVKSKFGGYGCPISF